MGIIALASLNTLFAKEHIAKPFATEHCHGAYALWPATDFIVDRRRLARNASSV
jgi:hypothetical protein